MYCRHFFFIIPISGRRVTENSGSRIWSENLMKLLFNSYGEFRWSSQGPVSQLHSPHLHIGAAGIFSDLLMSLQMLKREWVVESNGKLPHVIIPGKIAVLVPEFAVEDLPSSELQPWFLRLQQRTCPWAECSCWWWWFQKQVFSRCRVSEMTNSNIRMVFTQQSEYSYLCNY